MPFFNFLLRNPWSRSIYKRLSKDARLSGQHWMTTLILLLLIISVAALIANTLVWGDPMVFRQQPLNEEEVLPNCRHTAQGLKLITDDNGYVCEWKTLEPSSRCCGQDQLPEFSRWSCSTCNSSSMCCSVYEFCVSCCMDPDKEQIRRMVLRNSPTDPILIKLGKDTFEFCRGLCRTSSKSVFGQNQYRHENKYCYGFLSPPIQNDTETKISARTEDESLKQELIVQTREREDILVEQKGIYLQTPNQPESVKVVSSFSFGVASRFRSDASLLDTASWLRGFLLLLLLVVHFGWWSSFVWIWNCPCLNLKFSTKSLYHTACKVHENDHVNSPNNI